MKRGKLINVIDKCRILDRSLQKNNYYYLFSYWFTFDLHIDLKFILENLKNSKVEALFKRYLNFIFNIVLYLAAYLSDYGAQAI